MISPLNFTDSQTFLKQLLLEKNQVGSLSLRAVARRGGISASHLSRMASGERHLSVTAALRLSQILDLSPEEESHLMRLIAFDRMDKGSKAGQFVSRGIVSSKRRNRGVVTSDQFNLVADWQHFAILALLKVRGFRPHGSWIGSRLGISPSVAKEAFERLVRLGLIIKIDGRYQAAENGEVETLADVPSQAVRENHRQQIARAERALRELPVTLREFVNCTFAIHVSDVPKAKKRLRLFVERFMKDLEREQGEELFQLNLQFHMITKPEKK